MKTWVPIGVALTLAAGFVLAIWSRPATGSLVVAPPPDESAVVPAPAAIPQGAFLAPASTEDDRAGETNALSRWAEADFREAGAWAQRLDNLEERERALLLVLQEAIRTDPLAALQMAMDLRASPERDDLICRAAMEWAESEPAAAAAWARQMPEDGLRPRVLAGIAVAWSGQDVRAAAELALGELSASRLQSDTLVSIASRWAQIEPRAAAGWIAEFPDGQLKDDATTAILPFTALGK